MMKTTKTVILSTTIQEAHCTAPFKLTLGSRRLVCFLLNQMSAILKSMQRVRPKIKLRYQMRMQIFH